MEYLIIVAVILIGGLLYFGGKFANFKSKLMNELGRRGMDFHSADVLYTAMAHEINKLHHDGVPVSVIADIITQTNAVDRSTANTITTYSSFEEWLDVFKAECDKTKKGVSPFLEFMDISPLQKAYEAGKEPEDIAYQFAKDFDPEKIG